MEWISAGEYESFCIKKREYYLARFERFDALAGEFKATWNWSAFFFTCWWLLYRKLYLHALAAFFLFAIPHAWLPLALACGLGGNYFYYRKARKAVTAMHQAYPGQDIRGRLLDLGGVHSWVPLVGVVLVGIALLVCLVTGLLAALLAKFQAVMV